MANTIHIYAKLRMTRRKIKKTPGVCLDSKKTLKSYKRNPTFFFFFFLVTLFRVGFLLSVAYLTVANLARLGILVQC